MLAVLSFLAVVTVSLLVVRVATTALTLTGLSTPLARFQARSAFTGAGFTTTESEKVVRHPVRRRIIMLLMLLGNAGFVTAVSSLLFSFVGETEDRTPTVRIGLIAIGLVVLWLLATSSWVDRRLESLIAYSLRRFTSVEARDYAGLLRLTGDYVVAELTVDDGDWMAGRPLRSLNLSDEGVLVLGVERVDGTYVGTPRGETALERGDTALLYGTRSGIADLDRRKQGVGGAMRHFDQVAEHRGRRVAADEPPMTAASADTSFS